MIPHALVALVLVLGVFRIVRLIGWDDLPIVESFRTWVTGRTVYYNSTEGGEVYQHRRPLLAKFIECPWCVGAWVSLGAYLAWVFEPRWTIYFLMPWALSAAVGLLAKNLDP